MFIVFFIIALLATTVGSIAGIGGGIIIKPILDVMNIYDVSTISLLSSFTVFAMSITATINHVIHKSKIHFKTTTFLSIGAVIGGFIGQELLKKVVKLFNASQPVMLIQNFIGLVLLIFVVVFIRNRAKIKTYKVESLIICIIVGLVLGVFSSFLGIGGGPINVAILTLVFSMDTKEAAVNSIFTILFSQSSNILSLTFTTGLAKYDLSMAVYMIIGGILGGFIGAYINKKITNKSVERIFNILVISIIFVNAFNVVKALINF